MIVVDTSALIAILDKEPDAALYAEAIAEADPPLISAATLLELNIVMINRHGVNASTVARRGWFFAIAVSPNKSPLRRNANSRCRCPSWPRTRKRPSSTRNIGPIPSPWRMTMSPALTVTISASIAISFRASAGSLAKIV